jgi:hypothetical protein
MVAALATWTGRPAHVTRHEAVVTKMAEYLALAYRAYPGDQEARRQLQALWEAEYQGGDDDER